MKIIDVRENKNSDLAMQLLNRSSINTSDDVTPLVSEIIKQVQSRGDKAILEYSKRFDGADLSVDRLRITDREIEQAYEAIDQKLLMVIRRAKKNILAFHEKQKENSWFATEKEGVLLGQLYRALEVVGIYVPGGTASYPSSVLMNAIPARVAGVEKIVMVTPPGKSGMIHPAIIVAAKEAGVDEIYRVGGAQAIAALAFGTETIPKVDKIVGPGNTYVATAKRLVYGYCDIDMIAGPSEITIIADDSANPSFIAADLLSQAEHDALASSVLVTTSERVASLVQNEIARQLERLPRKEIAEKSIASFGAIVIVSNISEAIQFSNKIAPEHLELCVEQPMELLGAIKNAGAIFMGHYSPEPLGDYFAGPNHVLPTSGTARFFSPLNVGDFMKKSSIISYNRGALEAVKDDIILFAEAEGLTAHANAIRVRFEK